MYMLQPLAMQKRDHGFWATIWKSKEHYNMFIWSSQMIRSNGIYLKKNLLFFYIQFLKSFARSAFFEYNFTTPNFRKQCK